MAKGNRSKQSHSSRSSTDNCGDLAGILAAQTGPAHQTIDALCYWARRHRCGDRPVHLLRRRVSLPWPGVLPRRCRAAPGSSAACRRLVPMTAVSPKSAISAFPVAVVNRVLPSKPLVGPGNLLMRFFGAAVFLSCRFCPLSPPLRRRGLRLLLAMAPTRRCPICGTPTRDAADIGRALERLDFKVTQVKNATAQEMRKAVVEFGRSAEMSGIAVVFYAGHGMEVGGENWLIPDQRRAAQRYRRRKRGDQPAFGEPSGFEGTEVGPRDT